MPSTARRFLPLLTLAIIGCVGVWAYGGNSTTGGAQRPVTIITTQSALDTAIAKSSVPVIIDFHATWCGPCRQIAPELDAVALAHPGAVTVITIDVDDAPEIAQGYQVQGIPHLVLIRDGTVIRNHVGYADRDTLATWAELKR